MSSMRGSTLLIGAAAGAAALAFAWFQLGGGPEDEAGKKKKRGEAGTLVLKVRSGRDVGKSVTVECTGGVELTMGRLDTNKLLFTDEEVSGKHAVAAYDAGRKGWTLRDLGSLNGTRLNGKEIGIPGRRPGAAALLRHGDLLTLGETTTVEVIIGRATFRRPNFVWAVRGQPSRKHIQRHEPSEDEVTLALAPGGTSALYLFDGHCGRTAVAEAAEILPSEVAGRLPRRIPAAGVERELKQAFVASDKKILADHAGCTATAAIVWPREEGDRAKGCWLQVANVGDSLAVASAGGGGGGARVISSSHRLTDAGERERLQACGLKLREGETRLYGLQISRVIGDKFLKEEDVGLIAEPSVSEVVQAGGEGGAEIVIIATDGLWDELNPQDAIDVAVDAMNRYAMLKDGTNTQAVVDAAADALISRARGAQGLVDDTTVIVLKFGAGDAAEDQSVSDTQANL